MRSKLGYLLVVEDSEEDFDTILDAAKLASLTNEIQRVTSGEECLMYLQERDRSALALPILLLLDLNTPKGDGRDALRGIVCNDRLRAIPLVVLSASSNVRDVRFCYKHGANAYHLKPVNHPAHLLVLQSIFSYWLTCAVLPFAEGSERE